MRCDYSSCTRARSKLEIHVRTDGGIGVNNLRADARGGERGERARKPRILNLKKRSLRTCLFWILVSERITEHRAEERERDIEISA